MKVIFIATDRKIFEKDSAVKARFIEYGKLFDELHVIVFINIKYQISNLKITENVWIYPTNSSNRFLYIFDAIKIIRKLLASTNLKSEAVISTQDPFETGLVGVWGKLFYKQPLQVQLHTDFNNKYFILSSPLNFIRFFLAHITLPYADSVRVVSLRIKGSIKDLNQNIVLLPINIDSSKDNKELLPASRDASTHLIILTVARLEEEKDLETAIRAFKIVSLKYPEATFTIAGVGSEREKLGRLVLELGIEAKVNFIGWVDNLNALYDSAHIYISTSLFEGYGMSVVEAALRGLPLVLSNAGVAGEIPALVSKPKDLRDFASSLDKFLSNSNLRQEMGIKAREAALRHSIAKEEYLGQYRKALENISIKERSLIKAVFRGNKVLRFLIGGSTAAFTQILLLYIFTDIFGIWYLLSSALSFCIAFIISFLLQKFWVFRDREMKNSHVQLFKYIIVGLLGISLNTFSMYLFVTVLSLWYIFAQIVAGIIVAVFNFFVYRKFIFKPL